MGRFSNTGISIGTRGNSQMSFEQEKYSSVMAGLNKTIDRTVIEKKINPQKQERHNTRNNLGRSSLYGGVSEAQKIVDEYSGKGKPIGSNKERVECDHVIGEYVSVDGKTKIESNIAIIVYSKTGSHVYPGNPKGGK